MHAAMIQVPAPYRAFDDMLRERAIAFPRCGACGKFHWYPQPACPHCGSDALAWTRAPATGRLYTWTVVHRKLDPEFPGEAPYVVGLVEFDGIPGVRLVTNIVDTPIETLRLGMPVAPVFDVVEAAQPTVRFRAVAGDSS